MTVHGFSRFLLWAGALAVLTACSAFGAPLPVATSAPSVLSLASNEMQFAVTPTPPPVATPPATADSATTAAQNILIWWPAPLLIPDKTKLNPDLLDQIASFEADHASVRVTVRVKRVDGLGGILETLRTGSLVAPATLPDLTLLRRDDFVNAAASKLIHPVDPTVLGLDDLFPAGLTLSRVQSTPYGVPYALELQHLVYRTSVLNTTLKTLDDIRKAGQPFLFPAHAVKSVNAVFLAQYLQAGGHLAAENGSPLLDAVALRTVLSFYEDAYTAKVVTPSLLDYVNPGQYWPLYVSGKAAIAQVDSSTFLAQKATLTNTAVLPLLTTQASDQAASATVLDGWIWVLTTAEPDREARAVELLKWLLRAENQAALLQARGILPSRRSALDLWGTDSYLTFARSLLEGSNAPLPDTVNPVVAAALQASLEDVLSGRKPAELAANDAVAQVVRAAAQ